MRERQRGEYTLVFYRDTLLSFLCKPCPLVLDFLIYQVDGVQKRREPLFSDSPPFINILYQDNDRSS